MIESGTILQDRYLVKDQIGAGGMGAVYLATDQRFGSIVAIKETFFADENFKKAFEREARLLNSLRHSALPRVSDHFIDGNGQFIVMEYITGDDLSLMIERGDSFSQKDVLNWAHQLLDALDYLHAQELPIVHRDIKPQNLKLTPRGQIILLDFGLAKGNATNNEHKTAAKSVFGYSRAYAPLEQIQGTGTDPRSDLYSLSATLYHLLTGEIPSDALTRATSVLNNQPDTLLPPNEINPNIPASISNLLLRSMALNANYRPSSAAAMRAMLTESVANPNAETEINFQTTPLEIFSQNTQLIINKDDNAPQNVTQTVQVTNTSPTEMATQLISDPNPAPDLSETKTVVAENASVQAKKSGVGKALAATALAAILLGGGAFGGWYALNNSTVAPNPAASNNSVEKKPIAVDSKDETKSGDYISNTDLPDYNADISTSANDKIKETKKNSLSAVTSTKKDSSEVSTTTQTTKTDLPKETKPKIETPNVPDTPKVKVDEPPNVEPPESAASVDENLTPNVRLKDLKGLSPAQRRQIIKITKKAAEMQRKGAEMEKLGNEMDMTDPDNEAKPTPPKIRRPFPRKKP